MHARDGDVGCKGQLAATQQDRLAFIYCFESSCLAFLMFMHIGAENAVSVMHELQFGFMKFEFSQAEVSIVRFNADSDMYTLKQTVEWKSCPESPFMGSVKCGGD